MRALDGPVSPVRCAALDRDNAGATDDLNVGERLRPLWLKLQRALRDVLDSTTLDQLAYGTCLGAAPLPLSRPEPTAGDDGDAPTYQI